MLLEPCLHIARVTLDPRCLCTDAIKALRECHIEALGALALEECLDVFDVLAASEGGCRDRDDRAHQWQADRQSPLQLLPVVLDKLPECIAALGMSTQPREGQVDILLLHICAEGEIKRALDELWGLGTSKCTKSSVALEARLAVDSLVQDNLVLKNNR